MQVTVFGRTLSIELKAQPLRPLSRRGAWWPVVHEPFTGAWQQNAEIPQETVLAYSAVFACVTLIAADIGKVSLRLVEQDMPGIWSETQNSAYSPVLRKPNRYQTRVKFIEQWITSKLIHGNTYVLKQRDQRGLVVALYILDPHRVVPMVAADGSVYYELRRDDLSGLAQEQLLVPASEIIHDLMVPLYHPLIGVSPISACGLAAAQGLAIQRNSERLFRNASQPGGVLTSPAPLTTEQLQHNRTEWQTNFGGDNYGAVAILAGGLKYESLTMNAVDTQLIEQLKWTGETVCTCFHVPAYMVGIGPPPPYANIDPLVQQYYNQCLQSLFINLEVALDEGLGLGSQFGNRYGVEFDIDDLIWMNTAERNKAASDGIGSGGLAPNEARKKYYGLPPVAGGDTPYLQQQYYPLAALADRQLAPAPVPAPPVLTEPGAGEAA